MGATSPSPTVRKLTPPGGRIATTKRSLPEYQASISLAVVSSAVDEPGQVALLAVLQAAVHREVGGPVVAGRLDDGPAGAAPQQLVHALLDGARAVVAAGTAADRQVHHPGMAARDRVDVVERLQEAHRIAEVADGVEARRRQVDEDEIGVARRAWPGAGSAAAAGCDVQGVGAVAAVAGVADGGMVAQRLVGIGGAQRRVDLLAGIFAAIAEAVGMRGIVDGALVPERHQARRAVGPQEVRVREVETEVQRRHDAAAAGERRRLRLRPQVGADGKRRVGGDLVVLHAERSALP